MTDLEIESIKTEFIETYNNYITREGATKLLDWLQRSDFFTAPASTRFHGATAGGLAAHSLNTFKRLMDNVAAEEGSWSEEITEESIAIAGLLHDVCKVNYYKTEKRNVKVDGAWVQQDYYTIDDQLPYGHGEKSVYIINGFLRLTREEAMAINWHMGGFDDRVQGGNFSISAAYEKYPFAVMLHVSDMQATYIDENSRLNG